MRPIHMTVGGRPLVRHEFPGGVRVTLEEPGEARKADRPSQPMLRPVGGPAGDAGDTARETNYFSAAALKRRSDEATAEILRPLHRAFVALALGALVAAAAFTTVSLARLDRQIAIEARV